MKKYTTFDKIESEYPLAEMLNKAMNKMNILRMTCAPRAFSSDRLMHCPLFYETCLWETFFHELYGDLVRMRDILIEYLYEFDADWLKYARFQRDKWIDEWESKEEGELTCFTALSMLRRDDEVCMVRDTFLSELEALFGVLKECCSTDLISELSKLTGKEIKTYKMDSEGNAVPMSQAERQFVNIKNELEIDDIVEQLKTVITGVQGIYTNLSKMPDEQSNEAGLTAVFCKVNDFLNLKQYSL